MRARPVFLSTSMVDHIFRQRVFIVTEDPVQVAGRPQAMNIAMWTNDGVNCFIDTDYNYNPRLASMPVSIEVVCCRGLTIQTIGVVSIPDGPAIQCRVHSIFRLFLGRLILISIPAMSVSTR